MKAAEQIWEQNEQIEIAVSRANSFSSTIYIAIMAISIALLFLYTDGRLSEILLVSPLVALSYGVQWLIQNSSLVTDDANYLAAVTKVKRTMVVWAAMLLVQVAIYLIINGLPDLATILGPLVVDRLSERS